MQTTLFSMITFLTTVLMVSSAWAQAPSSAIDYSGGTYKAVQECLDKAAGNESAEKRCRIGIPGMVASAEESACTETEKELSLATKEFSKACSALRLSPGSNCESTVLSCRGGYNEYGDDEDEDKKKGKDDVDSEKYDACPIPALKDAKDAKEKIKKLEDDIDSLDDKIESAQEKVQEAQGNIDTKEAERLKRDNELTTAYETALQEKNLADKKKLEEAQEKVDAIEKALRELNQAKNDQDVQYAVDLAKIEGICEEIAEKALAAQIDGTVKAVQAGQLKKKDLNAQLALASTGRTQQNEDFRKREIARCRKDDAKWKKPIELLNLNYENNRLKIEEAIKEMVKKRGDAYTKATSGLQNEQQAEAQQLQTKLQNDLAKAKAEFDKEIGSCGGFDPTKANGQPNQTTTPNGCTGLKKLMADAMAKKANFESDRDDKKSNLEYYTELLRLASSKIKDVDATDVPDLLEAAKPYEDAADSFVSRCKDASQQQKRDKLRKSLSSMGVTPTVITEDPPGSDITIEQKIADAKATGAGKPDAAKPEVQKPSGKPAKSGK